MTGAAVPRPPLRASVADSGLDERPGAWRVLCPAEAPGPAAIVGMERGATAAFLRAYPGATVVTDEASSPRPVGAGVVRWRGGPLPLAPGSLALVVADERRVPPAAVRAALRPDGLRCAIVPARRPHDAVPYPMPDGAALERVLRRGWPPAGAALRHRMRHLLGATVLWRLTGRAGLVLPAGPPSLADLVVAGLERCIGGPLRLCGVAVSGGDNLVLRVRGAAVEAAVRLALTPLGTARMERQRRVLDALATAFADPGLAPHVPRELARGEALGHLWRAETWHHGTIGPAGRCWRPDGGRAWDEVLAVAGRLAALAPTGAAGPGWAHAWVGAMEHFGPGVADALEAALRPIEAAALPTAWCHGDLWPGNVVAGSGPAVVIDWEQARRDGPVGIDSVFVEIARHGLARRLPLGAAAAALLRGEAVPQVPPQVAGTSWAAASEEMRRAHLVAAFVVHAHGPTGDRRDGGWARANLDPVLAALG